nr:MAG TPA: hypothetical protein [Bacteriophage sp.]
MYKFITVLFWVLGLTLYYCFKHCHISVNN